MIWRGSTSAYYDYGENDDWDDDRATSIFFFNFLLLFSRKWLLKSKNEIETEFISFRAPYYLLLMFIR